MMDNYLERYVDMLYNNQNIGAGERQQNLFTKEQYYNLLKPVMDLVSEHKDDSLNELRNRLFENSGITEKVTKFVNEEEMTPGMVFTYGTANFRETVVIGNKQEVKIDDKGSFIPSIKKMTEDTIFDLASNTKIFTSLSILKLVQSGQINLNDKIRKYCPEYTNLEDTTIFDLMSFRVPLKTEGRVDTAPSKEEAEKVLHTMYVDKNSENLTPYTDMGAMVLKSVIEKVTNESFYKYVYENILKPLQMKDTYVNVPKYKLERVAPTYAESRVNASGNPFDMPYKAIGEVNDPKAYALGHSEGVLSGHAGMFSTAKDMSNLAHGIIGGQIIDDEYVEMMAKNRTGREVIKDGEKVTVQYLGFLCYSKNPVLSSSEVYHALSGRSFASGSFTGNQLTIDPLNELFLFLGSNRVHNRVSAVPGSLRDKLVNYDEKGKGTIVLPSGEVKTTSFKYAWDRDAAVIHPAICLAIQYKMLEDIYKLSKEIIIGEEHVRRL